MQLLRKRLGRFGEYKRKIEYNENYYDHSNVCLSGGIVNIEKTRYPDFLLWYSNCIFNNGPDKSGICEIRTDPFFHLYHDLDYLFNDEYPMNEIINDIIIIQQVVMEHYKEFFEKIRDDGIRKTIFTMYVMTSNKKRTTHDGKVKTGVHIVWPYIVIDIERALIMREAIINRMKKEKSDLSWDDIIDGKVYMHGLRMPYTTKDINSEEYYEISLIIDGHSNVINIDKEEIERNETLFFKLIRACSIRCITFTNVQTPHWNNIYNISVDIPSFERKRARVMPPEFNSAIIDSLTNIIRSITPYQNISIESIDKRILDGREESNPTYFIQVTSSMFDHGDKYCFNKNGYHNSAKIYFMINIQGLFQKCWCQCQTKYKTPCKYFKRLIRHENIEDILDILYTDRLFSQIDY